MTCIKQQQSLSQMHGSHAALGEQATGLADLLGVCASHIRPDFHPYVGCQYHFLTNVNLIYLRRIDRLQAGLPDRTVRIAACIESVPPPIPI